MGQSSNKAVPEKLPSAAHLTNLQASNHCRYIAYGPYLEGGAGFLFQEPFFDENPFPYHCGSQKRYLLQITLQMMFIDSCSFW